MECDFVKEKIRRLKGKPSHANGVNGDSEG